MGRREKFGLYWDAEASRWREDIPDEVAYITAGVDVQPNRLEVVFIGHSPDHTWILGHHVILGNATLDTTWDELRALLSTQWKHPLGGVIGVEAAAVDSGDGNMTQYVYNFCEAFQANRWYAIKGRQGAIPVFKASSTRRRLFTAPLFIVGVDQVKTQILINLRLSPSDQNSFRFSETLEPSWFEQFTSERRVVKYQKSTMSGTKPVIVFERIGRRKAEALDCVVYGLAVRQAFALKWGERYEQLKQAQPGKERRTLRDLGARLNR
jgi:phage terminase large subunit GpA-like protein